MSCICPNQICKEDSPRKRRNLIRYQSCVKKRFVVCEVFTQRLQQDCLQRYSTVDPPATILEDVNVRRWRAGERKTPSYGTHGLIALRRLYSAPLKWENCPGTSNRWPHGVSEMTAAVPDERQIGRNSRCSRNGHVSQGQQNHRGIPAPSDTHDRTRGAASVDNGPAKSETRCPGFFSHCKRQI